MRDVHLDALDAREDRLKRAQRLAGAQRADLGGRVAVDFQQQESAIARAADVDFKALVGLVVHFRILGRVGPQNVTKDLERPARGVQHVVEERAVVGRPLERVIGV